MQLVFTSAALRDLRGRLVYLNREASPAIAERFLKAVENTAATLQHLPHTGTLCVLRSPRLEGVRRLFVEPPFAKWLLVYKLEALQVLILRVLHTSQNWQRHF